ncbi:hypothetical protein CK203_028995 [Vitis vinifera]|uniref:Reverse transcriptase zinc-binding domain-containing protein n=1 Tax=Vitis vinifera TaxID=29760 RepID=A0A438IMR6_VITVI|nr:hypothetical protein CK203_028995 [Vitis vinifera]
MDHSQVIKNGSGHENNVAVTPATLVNAQNPVESDFGTAAAYNVMDNTPGPASQAVPLNMPLQTNMFTHVGRSDIPTQSLHGSVSDVENIASQPLPHFSHGRPCTTDCAVPSNTVNEPEELTIESGTVSISSAYSQGVYGSFICYEDNLWKQVIMTKYGQEGLGWRTKKANGAVGVGVWKEILKESAWCWDNMAFLAGKGYQNQILDRYLVYWYSAVPLFPPPLCHGCSYKCNGDSIHVLRGHRPSLEEDSVYLVDRVPTKVAFFAWEATWEKVLTLDRLQKRGLQLPNYVKWVFPETVKKVLISWRDPFVGKKRKKATVGLGEPEMVSSPNLLLNSLTQALQSSGVDLSQASISVQIDIGKRANKGLNATTSNAKDYENPSPSNRTMAHSGFRSSSEDSDQAHKRLRTDTS